MSQKVYGGLVVEMQEAAMTRTIWKLIKENLISPVEQNLHSWLRRMPQQLYSRTLVSSVAPSPRWEEGWGFQVETDVEVAKWHHPEYSGNVFKEAIICRIIPLTCERMVKSIIISHHAYGDQYRATDFVVPGPAKVDTTYTPVMDPKTDIPGT